jgi:hypothetical protein
VTCPTWRARQSDPPMAAAQPSKPVDPASVPAASKTSGA